MKLQVEGIHCDDCVRAITEAVLRVDLGARINVATDARQVRIEGRVSVDDARRAIERRGFAVASVVDARAADTAFRRHAARAIG